MNALVIPTGAPFTLPPGDGCWQVRSGELEAYLVSSERRRLIAIVEPGGFVCAVEQGALSISIIALEDVTLRPVSATPRRVEAWRALVAETAGLPLTEDMTDIGSVAAGLNSHFAGEDHSRDQTLLANLFCSQDPLGQPKPGSPPPRSAMRLSSSGKR